MHEPLEETYFNWLYSKVASVDVPTPSLTHYTLLRDLHSIEFIYSVQGDDNRASDGLDVRREFNNQIRTQDVDISWMNIGCSVLEMMIAFARTADFETNIGIREWFWTFIENLDLGDCSDADRRISERVGPIIERFLWRTYHYNGHGGMFPLRYPEQDQREVEIWYQFCAYLVEQENL